MPVFEFDDAKSFANFEKHGIDFVSAQELWKDVWSIRLPIEHAFEARFMAIGIIEEKCWTVIFTKRSENIRLISVRRSRKNETEIYNRGRV